MAAVISASLFAPVRAPVATLRARKVGGRRTIAAPIRAEVATADLSTFAAEGERGRLYSVTRFCLTTRAVTRQL